ncbi:hypothetical protein K490DRAFT_68898 [Saccharata proteae CBS 121410]|uniref:Uncharacterized protein n=1 Tax=Saccharata proteae CBS 121410 TaxID=1314787 RepID=A0A9P4HQU4_9PEZI|nr:hypothetical protein K490DRAFT_68898 [Saccharata proteae CBS 121410]
MSASRQQFIRLVAANAVGRLSLIDIRRFLHAYLTNEYSPHATDHGVLSTNTSATLGALAANPNRPAVVPATLPPQHDRWINLGQWIRDDETGTNPTAANLELWLQGRTDWANVEQLLFQEAERPELQAHLRNVLVRFGAYERFSRQRTKLEERGQWGELARQVLLDRELIRVVWGDDVQTVAPYLEAYAGRRFSRLRSEEDFEVAGVTRLAAGVRSGVRSFMGGFAAAARPRTSDGLRAATARPASALPAPASRPRPGHGHGDRPPRPRPRPSTGRPATSTGNPPAPPRRPHRPANHLRQTLHHHHSELIPAGDLALQTPTERLLRRTVYHFNCACGARHQFHLELDIRPDAQLRSPMEPGANDAADRLPSYDEAARGQDVIPEAAGEERSEPETQDQMVLRMQQQVARVQEQVRRRREEERRRQDEREVLRRGELRHQRYLQGRTSPTSSQATDTSAEDDFYGAPAAEGSG